MLIIIGFIYLEYLKENVRQIEYFVFSVSNMSIENFISELFKV
jgi:hypothetical protein